MEIYPPIKNSYLTCLHHPSHIPSFNLSLFFSFSLSISVSLSLQHLYFLAFNFFILASPQLHFPHSNIDIASFYSDTPGECLGILDSLNNLKTTKPYKITALQRQLLAKKNLQMMPLPIPATDRHTNKHLRLFSSPPSSMLTPLALDYTSFFFSYISSLSPSNRRQFNTVREIKQ